VLGSVIKPKRMSSGYFPCVRLCVPSDYHKKQPTFPYTTLVGTEVLNIVWAHYTLRRVKLTNFISPKLSLLWFRDVLIPSRLEVSTEETMQCDRNLRVLILCVWFY
jgi:hypothetical protein